MIECVFEFIKKNDEKKQIIVKERLFKPESEDFKKAKKQERNLFCIAKEQGYNVLCNGRIIYDHLKAQEYRIKKLEKRKQRLLEIEEEFQKKKREQTSISLLELSIELELIKAFIKYYYLSESQIQEARI